MLMLVGRVGRSPAAADRHMAGQCTALTSFQCLQTHVQGRRPACGQATAFGAADALVKDIQKAKRALLQRQQACKFQLMRRWPSSISGCSTGRQKPSVAWPLT